MNVNVLIRDWLLDPLALLFLLSLIAIGLLIVRVRRRQGNGRRRRTGGAATGACALWIVGFLVASAPVIVNPLVAAVESVHDDTVCAPGGVIVVLGGGVDSRVEEAAEYERMDPATLARVAAAERLGRAEPATTLILVGGGPGGAAEADVMAQFLIERGIEPQRLLRETRSSSTVENARNVAALLAAGSIEAMTEEADAEETGAERDGAERDGAEGADAERGGANGAVAREAGADDTAEPVAISGAGADAAGEAVAARLITSALHVPRAVATFERAGVDVCPVAVDRLAITDIPPWALMPQTTALLKFDRLMHELVALVAYRVAGYL